MASNWRAEGTLRDYLTRQQHRRDLRHRHARADARAAVGRRHARRDRAPAASIPTTWSTRRARFRRWKARTSCKDVTVRRRRSTTVPPADDEFVVAPDAAGKRPLRVAAYDFGMKWNILRRFAAHGCDVRVYPATTPASELLATKPDGVFLSNGPGDPAVLDYAIDNAQDAGRERRADVRHLPRPPDARPGDGRADVQAQVRPPRRQSSGEGPARPARSRSRRRTTGSRSIRRSLPHDVEVTHLNLYDGTIEGLRHTSEAGLLRAVPPGGRARPARRGLSVRAVPRRDGEAHVADAQAHRSEAHSRHRLRPDRHRPGVRVRLLRHAGLQGAARRGPRGHPRQQQSGDDHDRPGDWPTAPTSSR